MTCWARTASWLTLTKCLTSGQTPTSSFSYCARVGELDTAFERAIYMMFLVSEVHPFDDGNGRIDQRLRLPSS